MAYRFSHRSYRLPLRIPLRTAHGAWSEREGLLLRLEDDIGRIGYGEVAPIPWFGTETVAEALEVCHGLSDKPSEDMIAAVPERFGCVRFGLASAVEEVARGLRTRLSETTRPEAGFHPEKCVPVAALLPAGLAVLECLPARLEAGYICFKWKVGVGTVADELALLDDVLARLPAHARLRLDANGAWDRPSATKWLTRCADRPIEFVEQPLPPTDRDGLRGLAADYPVSLALDESVANLEDARRWQGEGWRGLFVIKPALAGSLSELADWVSGTKADVVISSAIETALGRAFILRFVLAHPELTRRAVGFGLGNVFGDRCWDGPVLGPVLDCGWVEGVNPEALWNTLS